ncbi:MAG TPA: SDR family NAD(P)-dependent oxidoreductase [Blastocatellia bacterium]|nr:SDR family NAD(P)-dependent oxidoreductase [Blastocatellia bacterium]
MTALDGRVSLVTGASRGVGRGIALELCEANAIVYTTARAAPHPQDSPAKEVMIQCDHRDDKQVESVSKRIADEHGRLDILVNNVWGGYEDMVENGQFTWTRPFWEQPVWRWDAMFQAGVRAHYICSQLAARMMVRQRSGLIVNISFWAAQKHIGNVANGVSKAATDKMTADMAHELAQHNVAVISLYPGLVRTEKVMESAAWLDLSNSESPMLIGRAVAALASDPNIMNKTGQVHVAAAVALEYGFTDVDGKQPRPLTLSDV